MLDVALAKSRTLISKSDFRTPTWREMPNCVFTWLYIYNGRVDKKLRAVNIAEFPIEIV